MNIGYGFWGFLGDKKFNDKGKEISTPDGNAFYSWSIIKALQNKGHKVFALMPDRDFPGFEKLGNRLFNTFAKDGRCNTYLNTINYIDYHTHLNSIINNKVNIEEIIEDKKLNLSVDLVIWEWRMPIPGRNIELDVNDEKFQPDYILQDILLNYFKQRHIPVYILDLDYKIEDKDIEKYDIKGILELGNKWKNYRKCYTSSFYIPFDFNYINEFEIKKPEELIVYVGNRYERDWCIDKYIPGNVDGVTVYGNWLESNRDSANKWPNIKFGKRLQLSEMYEAYSKAAVTPLLAKEEYCTNSFMTARLIEAIFYGCLPLIIKEFKNPELYIPEDLVNTLLVNDKEELLQKAIYYKEHPEERKELIRILRYELGKKFDSKNFATKIENLM